jgi:rsbT co-antagonist protein RsbR
MTSVEIPLPALYKPKTEADEVASWPFAASLQRNGRRSLMSRSVAAARIPQIILEHQNDLLSHWISHQLAATTLRPGLITESELRDQSQRFLALLRAALQSQDGSLEIDSPSWNEARELLTEISRGRARQGFAPSETAMFVFSLKQPLFDQIRATYAKDPEGCASEIWTATMLLDRLGLFTTEVFQKGREDVIVLQQQEMLELSTPVMQLWDSILALPLIGTLDSARTQVVMESLLQKIVDTAADIAIIDITGVPTVDTLVAQHLLKTVAADRLMGADCYISGIGPQIAQTIVQLGVELKDIVTKATLADAFRIAIERSGFQIAQRGRGVP